MRSIDMKIDTKQAVTHIRKGLILSIKSSYRAARDHPFLAGLVFFLLLLYSSHPSLFGFLVASSPVVICTALLLGTLLSFGEQNIPEIEEEEKKKTHDVSTLQVHGSVDDLVHKIDDNILVESLVSRGEIEEEQVTSSLQVGRISDNVIIQKDEISAAETHLEYSRDEEPKEPVSDEGKGVAGSDVDREPVLTAHDVEERDANAICTHSVVEEEKLEVPADEDKLEMHIKDRLGEDREASSVDCLQKTYFEKPDEGVSEVVECAECASGLFIHPPESNGGVRVEIGESKPDSCFYSLLSSSNKPVVGRDGFSDSDGAESSSPDASMADIIPMLDELHPLLESELSRPVRINYDDSDESSGVSSEDQRSDYGSEDEVAENQEDVYGSEEEVAGNQEDDEEEAQEEKDAGTELVVTWTAADEKNLMDLGTSELERNQRLENLIAKRRARKRAEMGNLIDFGDYDSASLMDRFSHLHVQISPVSTKRRNPFDFLSEQEGIPGSAPSVLLRRPNPFDFPRKQSHKIDNTAREGMSHQQFISSQQDFHPQILESFASGESLPEDYKEKMPKAHLAPYFVPEQIVSEEASYAHYQRQLSRMSAQSSLPESESVSSVPDQEYHKELLEQDLRQENELISPAKHDEATGIEIWQEEREINLDSGYESIYTASDVKQERKYGGPTSSEAAEEGIRCEELPISYAPQSEVIDEYDVTGSCSSELIMSFYRSADGGVDNMVQIRDDTSKGSGDFVESVLVEHVLPSRRGEEIDGRQLAESSSSSQAIEKSNFDSALLEPLLEPLLSADKGSSSPIPQIESNMQADISKVSSTPSEEKHKLSDDEVFITEKESMNIDSLSTNGGFTEAASNWSSIRETEAHLGEVAERGIHGIFQVGVSGEDYSRNDPCASGVSESVTEEIVHSVSFSSTEIDKDKYSLMDRDMSHLFDGNEKPDAPRTLSDEFLIPDYLTFGASEKVRSPLNESAVQPSDSISTEHRITILPPIPEENIVHNEQEDQSNANVGLTGSQITDDAEELSLLQGEAAYEVGDSETIGNVCHVCEDEDSVVSPAAFTQDDGFIGICITQPMRSMDPFFSPEGKSEIMKADPDTNSPDLEGEKSSEVPREHENVCIENSNELGGEAAEADAVVDEIKEVDEGILSELDVVGDFRVEEFFSGGSESEQRFQFYDHLYEAVEGSVDLAEAQVNHFQIQVPLMTPEVPSDIDYNNSNLPDQKGMTSDSAFSKLEPLAEDAEFLEDSSKLHILEARSAGEVYSVSSDKQLVTDSQVGFAEMELTAQDADLTETSADVLNLEATSFEDIGSSYKQPIEDKADPLPIKIHSDIQEVEARSHENLHLVLNHHSESFAENLEKDHPDKSAIVGSVEKNPVLISGPVESFQSKTHLESTEMHSDLHDVEIQSLKDLNLVLMHEHGSTSENTQQLNDDKELREDEAQTLEDAHLALEHSGGVVELPCEQISEEKTQPMPTEFHSNLQEDEVHSVEDMDLALNRTSVGIVEQTIDQGTEYEKHSALVEMHTGLQEVQARCLEDINFALKHHSEGSEYDVSKQITEDTRPELVGIHSDLHEIESGSLDDIHLALRKFSVGTTDNPEEVSESENVFDDLRTTERHTEPNLEIHSNMHEVEARSLDDIHLALKEFSMGTTDVPEDVNKAENLSHGPNLEIQLDLHEVNESENLSHEPNVEVQSNLHDVDESEDLSHGLNLEIQSDLDEVNESKNLSHEPNLDIQSDLHEVKESEDLSHELKLGIQSQLHEVNESENLSHEPNLEIHSDPHEVESENLPHELNLETESALHEVNESGNLPHEPNLEIQSNLHEVEAKSLDDLHLLLKQFSVGTADTPEEVNESENVSHEPNFEIHTDLHEVEARSLDDIHLALKQFSVGTANNLEESNESKNVSDVPDLEIHSEHEVGARCIDDISTVKQFSVGTTDKVEDTNESEIVCDEPNVEIQSDLHEIEAQSLDDIHFAVKQFSVGTTASTDYLSESENVANDPNLEIHSDLHEVEAQSLDDLAIKQFSVGTTDNDGEVDESYNMSNEPNLEIHSDLHEVEPRSLDGIHLVLKPFLAVTTDHPEEVNECENASDEPSLEIHSGLHEVEARSLDDIHLTLKPVHVGTTDHPEEVNESENVSHELETTDRYTESSSEIHSELHEVDAQSLEDIHFALKQVSAGTTDDLGKEIESTKMSCELETNGNHTQSDVHEVEVGALEDMHLKQFSEGSTDNPEKMIGSKIVPCEIGATERLMEPSSLESNADEVELASKEAPLQTDTTELSPQKLDAADAGASSSKDDSPRKGQEKMNSSKSGSSSSSNSSSDSD